MNFSSKEMDLHAQNQLSDNQHYEPIAIIGMGCRFPGGANDYQTFWKNLAAGHDAIQETPADRWNIKDLFSSEKENRGTMISRWGGYIDGIDEFDPQYFGISPREASFIDPQQRKLLEVAVEALEDGAQKPSSLHGKAVGVYVGGFTLDYKILQFTNPEFDNLDAHTATGIMMTMLSNRISYSFDFRGPSLSVDTACSSSLVAIHLACQSLQRRESVLALAGGALIKLAPQYTISESKGGFLSPTGSSHAFDESANGYVRSEGIGLVVLKRLDEAIRDNDPIHAVIIGSAVNQDGRTKGITVPSSDAQYRLMKEAYGKAKVAPGHVQYIEAHGTGTPVGDPIEAASIGRFLKEGRQAQDKCYIGSVKTNIGHTEAAAGIAGLIKTVMAIKHKKIPPHLHLKNTNPNIESEGVPYEIPTTLVDWPEHEGPAIAGVNSFGFGGTNAHVVIREYQAEQQKPAPNVQAAPMSPYSIVPLSHHDQDLLISQAAVLKSALESQPHEDQRRAYDLAYTWSTRRDHQQNRMAVIYRDQEDLLKSLDAYIEGHDTSLIQTHQALPESDRKLVWVFTGMGPQWWGMGREMYEQVPLFRSVIQECDAHISRMAHWSLIEELMKGPEHSQMAHTWLSQPANFAVQIALAAVWKAFGIRPDAIVGHSTGEVAAFYEAGVYTLEEAVTVVLHRSRLQHQTHGLGTMLAVGISEQDARNLIAPFRDRVSIAAVNSPKSLTLAGDKAALQQIAKRLDSNTFAKFLKVEVPYHSQAMDHIKDQLFAALEGLRSKAPSLPLYSTVTGCEVSDMALDAAYWWKNVRGTVYFEKAISQLLNRGLCNFLEIGPHPVLANNIQETAHAQGVKVQTVHSVRREKPEQLDVITSLARLHTLGFDIDWTALYPGGKLVRLPRYPWKKDRYWAEPEYFSSIRTAPSEHPLLGKRRLATEPTWYEGISPERYPYLVDHKIQGDCILPAAGYMEMALAIMNQLAPGGLHCIDHMTFEKGLFMNSQKLNRLKSTFNPQKASFQIASTNSHEATGQTVHATGTLRKLPSRQVAHAIKIEETQQRLHQRAESEIFYQKLGTKGYNYGPDFQGVRAIWLGNQELLSRIEAPDSIKGSLPSYVFHPGLLDSCFQSVIFSEIHDTNEENFSLKLPIEIEAFKIDAGKIPEKFWCHIKITHKDEEKVICNISLCDDEGEVFAEIHGFVAKSIESVSLGVKSQTIDKWLYDVQWQPSEVVQKHAEEMSFQNKTWLIFADKTGLADALARCLRLAGSHCLLVYPELAGSYRQESDKVWLDPRSSEHFMQLIQQVKAMKADDVQVIHGWALDFESEALDTHHAFQTFKAENLYSLMHLVNSTSKVRLNHKLWVLTRKAQPIAETASDFNILGAAVWGLCRVLAQQEHTGSWKRIIDLDGKQDLENILAELSMDADPEHEVGYRLGQRYHGRITPCENLPRHFPTSFPAQATYLVTGAFGAIGRLVCEFLARNGVQRLILMSRSGLPERGTWLDINEQSPHYDRISFVRSIENLGVDVTLASVDVRNSAQIQAYLDWYDKQSLPAINGVFYCAGVVRDTLVPNMNETAFDEVFDTKVVGAYALHQHFKNRPLDYFVLFSSIASLVTTAGQTNYAAANAFLDALSHLRRQSNRTSLSINWGPWAIGMIKELNLVHHYKKSRGMNCIMPDAGMKVLERVIGFDKSQVLVCDANWRDVINWYSSKSPSFSHLAAEESSQTPEDESNFISLYRAEAHDGRIDLVKKQLLMLVSRILRSSADDINEKHPLVNLGIDSIMATELRGDIVQTFGCEISLMRILADGSITSLTQEIHGSLSRSIIELESPVSSLDVPAAQTPEADKSWFETREVEDEFPLSYGQRAIWFIHQLNPKSPAYNISGVMHIPTSLDTDALEKAIQAVKKRHPSLRTGFFLGKGEPLQRVYQPCEEKLTVVEASHQSWEEIKNEIVQASRIPFDLSRDKLVRIQVYRQTESSYYFAITIHHIISDAWSNYLFINEMQAFYAHFSRGETLDLKEIKHNFREFVEWEAKFVNSPRGSSAYKFWVRQLPQELPTLSLPYDKPLPPVMTNNGSSILFTIDKSLSEQLKALSRSEKVTPFTVFLGAYYLLLHKYSQQEDIIIGTPVSGRTRTEFAQTYGYFVNPLPLWVNFAEIHSFQDILRQVRDRILTGLENQEYPFSLLVDRLDLDRDPRLSAIFQALFVYLNPNVERSYVEGTETAQYKGFPMSLLDIPEEEGQFPLTLSMYEENGQFKGTFKYNTDLFHASTIMRMSQHYVNILSQVAGDSTLALSDLRLLTAEETQKIIGQWSGLPAMMEAFEPIHRTIEKQAEACGPEIAISLPLEHGQSLHLSYAELNTRANRLARWLQSRNSDSGKVVGICMKKCPDMITAMLAVLKSGHAFTILDPELPKDRLSCITKDLHHILTNRESYEVVERGFILENIWGEIEHLPSTNLELKIDGEQLAYLVYTSGSSGRPKGVQVSHKNIASIGQAWSQEMDLGTTHAHLQMASPSFDVFCGDFVRALCHGKRLVLCRREVLLNHPLLYQVMLDHKVDFAEFVPSVLRKFIAYIKKENRDLRFMHSVIVGSEKWHRKDHAELRSLVLQSTRILNTYGISEATIDSTYFRDDPQDFSESEAVPIGKPFRNTAVFILDRYLDAVPVGLPGEIYIAGQGVAVGYCDASENMGKFLHHSGFQGSPLRLYRSGDIAKWDEKGNIHLIGRNDAQVKIRGIRIELSEIEKALLDHPSIRHAIVTLKSTNKGEPQICAYYQTSTKFIVAEDQMRQHLSERLPAYMVPALIHPIDKFPELPNGKIDFHSLPIPETGHDSEPFQAPQDLYQQRLAAIWSEMLGVRNISLHDDFFKLGGNSLALIELLIRIQDSFSITLSVNTLFQNISLQKMASMVEEIVTGRREGSSVFITYNPSEQPTLFCFPPAGGYSIVYEKLAEHLRSWRLVSFNYLLEPNKIAVYSDLIGRMQPQGEIALFGYSLGGNLAFEVAKELEARGRKLAKVIIMDSHRIQSEDLSQVFDYEKFESELKQHFNAHVGSSHVHTHTMKQARDYVEFCNQRMNLGKVHAEVHHILEDHPSDIHRDARTQSWTGSSYRADYVHFGQGSHAEMLREAGFIQANAELIHEILD